MGHKDGNSTLKVQFYLEAGISPLRMGHRPRDWDMCRNLGLEAFLDAATQKPDVTLFVFVSPSRRSNLSRVDLSVTYFVVFIRSSSQTVHKSSGLIKSCFFGGSLHRACEEQFTIFNLLM